MLLLELELAIVRSIFTVPPPYAKISRTSFEYCAPRLPAPRVRLPETCGKLVDFYNAKEAFQN